MLINSTPRRSSVNHSELFTAISATNKRLQRPQYRSNKVKKMHIQIEWIEEHIMHLITFRSSFWAATKTDFVAKIAAWHAWLHFDRVPRFYFILGIECIVVVSQQKQHTGSATIVRKYLITFSEVERKKSPSYAILLVLIFLFCRFYFLRFESLSPIRKMFHVDADDMAICNDVFSCV